MPTKTVNLLITFLGVIILAVVVGAIVLTSQGKTIPGELIGLGGTALGALVTLLTRPPTDAAGVAQQVLAAQPPPIDVSGIESAAQALLDGVQQAKNSAAGTPTFAYVPPADSPAPATGTAPDVPIV